MAHQKPIMKNNLHPLKIADAARNIRHVFIRDLVLPASIGAFDHETGKLQKIQINVDLSVDEAGDGHNDSLKNVVCYDKVIGGIKNILAGGHIMLVETLAERIADLVLQDPRVFAARVRVEKLEAAPEATSVGVEIERHKA